jgi:hypothetical protein
MIKSSQIVLNSKFCPYDKMRISGDHQIEYSYILVTLV